MAIAAMAIGATLLLVAMVLVAMERSKHRTFKFKAQVTKWVAVELTTTEEPTEEKEVA